MTDPRYWLERAARAAERIAGEPGKGSARLAVAEGYSKAEDRARAREEIDKARAGGLSGKDHSKAFSLLAEIEAAEGNEGAALEAALRIDEKSERMRALGLLAQNLARRRSLAGGLAILERIESPSSKVFCLLDIARRCGKQGDHLGLLECLVRVRALLPRIEDAKRRAEMTAWCNRLEAAPGGSPKAGLPPDRVSTGRLKRVLSNLPADERSRFLGAYLGITLPTALRAAISKDKPPFPLKRPDLLSLLESFWAGDLEGAGSALEGYLQNEGQDPSRYLGLLFGRLLALGRSGELESWSARVSALEPRSEVLACLGAAGSLRARERRKRAPEPPQR